MNGVCIFLFLLLNYTVVQEILSFCQNSLPFSLEKSNSKSLRLLRLLWQKERTKNSMMKVVNQITMKTKRKAKNKLV